MVQHHPCDEGLELSLGLWHESWTILEQVNECTLDNILRIMQGPKPGTEFRSCEVADPRPVPIDERIKGASITTIPILE
jgi:hypothetical protein